MKQLEQYLNTLIKGVGALCAIALILLVCTVAFNAVARYGFNYISIGFEEMAWHLNAIIFMLGMSFALHTGHHVRVDIIYQNLTIKHRAWIDLVGSVLFLLPFCIILIYYGWDYMQQSYATSERSEHPTGLPYRFIIKGLIFASFSVLLLATVSFVIHKINLLRGVSLPDDKNEVIH